MADVKRWSVTYTKHVTQKRKVYQDGFLEIQESSRKVKLYDDCEKLLQISFLKKEDIVSSGETLTLEAYLVDIGDIEGHQKPVNDLKVKGCEIKSGEKSSLFHGKKMDYSAATGVNQSRRKKGSLHNLSPSQKLIGEFKKKEMNKYEAPLRCPEMIKSTYYEWQVLYTTQKTQKAKKYHDGIIRVTVCGTQGRQVVLYDLHRELLDSRFLKKDEVVRSGESLVLDGHLVDIGERQGEHKPLDLKIKDSSSSGGKQGLSNGQQAGHSTCAGNNTPTTKLPEAAKAPREWHVLYTSQITQKAKKYHCGILKVSACNSYQMQATLLDEAGNILSRKFMKSSEDVSRDSTIAFSNYLVEVGELITIPEGKPPKHEVTEKELQSKSVPLNIGNSGISRVSMDEATHNRKRPTFNIAEKEVELKSSPSNISTSRMGKVPMEKPMRDANEILSVLRKFSNQEGRGAVKSACAEQDDTSRSKVIQSDNRSLEQEHSNKGTRADNLHEAGLTQSVAALPDFSELETAYAVDMGIRGESHLKYFSPSGSSMGLGASDVSTPNYSEQQNDQIILEQVSSAAEPQIKLEHTNFTQAPTTSLQDESLNRSVNAASSCHGDPFSEEMSAGVSLQHIDNDEEKSGIHSRFEARVLENSSGRTTCDQSVTTGRGSGVHKRKSMTDDLPSFDLGF